MKKYWQIIKALILYIILTGASIIMSFPLFWMISSSVSVCRIFFRNWNGILSALAMVPIGVYMSGGCKAI